jgi:glycine/sarcosine N-methyltransferase
MYDTLSSDYDRFVDWPARLGAELPFLEHALAEAGAHRVLDAACGTGRHAIELARRGYSVSAADFSAGMIAQARANASAAGAEVLFEQSCFGGMRRTFGAESFDALLCLGNSLPHAGSPSGVSAALGDFAACLKPGGLLILQNRNFDRVFAARERWIDPQSRTEDGREWLFIRFYDFEPDGSITFHILTLRREAGGSWDQSAASTRLWPLREADLLAAVDQAGFEAVEKSGSMQAKPFDSGNSPDLIVAAKKNSRFRG